MSLLNTFSKTLFFSVFIFLVACSSSDATPLAEISPQQAARIVESNNAVIIDVRTQEEWDAGHIPGAIHIPLSEVKGRLDEFKAFEGKTLVMQCRSGKRSASAGKILLSAGYENVSNLTGGINAWGKAKLPVEQ
jgi:rhodanese-related sulfurtransferase